MMRAQHKIELRSAKNDDSKTRQKVENENHTLYFET